MAHLVEFISEIDTLFSCRGKNKQTLTNKKLTAVKVAEKFKLNLSIHYIECLSAAFDKLQKAHRSTT
jgi:hypothetical protein